jgi:hypothetical protein
LKDEYRYRPHPGYKIDMANNIGYWLCELAPYMHIVAESRIGTFMNDVLLGQLANMLDTRLSLPCEDLLAEAMVDYQYGPHILNRLDPDTLDSDIEVVSWVCIEDEYELLDNIVDNVGEAATQDFTDCIINKHTIVCVIIRSACGLVNEIP